MKDYSSGFKEGQHSEKVRIGKEVRKLQGRAWNILDGDIEDEEAKIYQHGQLAMGNQIMALLDIEDH